MVTIVCDNCQSSFVCFEGDHGSPVGQCPECGFGYGGYGFNEEKWNQWMTKQQEIEREQAHKEFLERISGQGYYLVNDYGNVFGPFRTEGELYPVFWKHCDRRATIYQDQKEVMEFEANWRHLDITRKKGMGNDDP